MAPMIAPNPLGIKRTPQITKPLLKTKFKKLSMMMGIHCLPLGKGCFLKRKYNTKTNPPKNCLIPISCSAGIAVTAIREAIHVVPQKKLTQANAKYAFPFSPLIGVFDIILLAIFFIYNIDGYPLMLKMP